MENIGINNIIIDIGVSTSLVFDFTDFDWEGSINCVIFNIKNDILHEPIVTRRIYKHQLTTVGDSTVFTTSITPDESLLLHNGAQYDFTIVLDTNKYYKATETGWIKLRQSMLKNDLDYPVPELDTYDNY